MEIKTTDLENTVVLKDIQNDMKRVVVNGKDFAVAIKTNDGVILDHVKTSNSDDDTVFPNKPNGQVIKTWNGTADYVLEFVQNN